MDAGDNNALTDSSTSSTSSSCYESVIRGKGRRGGKDSHGIRVTGEGSDHGRGRGRGKRKQTGVFHFEDDEVDRMKHLRMMRKRKAGEFVDSLTAEGCRKILKSVIQKTPNLILTVAAEMQKESGPSKDPKMPDQPEWCICSRCREIPSDVSRVCCNMRPDLCHSIMPEMDLSITIEGVLQIQQLYRNDMFRRFAVTEEDINASMRHAAYRQYILFHFGKLGQGVRRPVPSCCTWFIRDKYPDPNNYYVPYEPLY